MKGRIMLAFCMLGILISVGIAASDRNDLNPLTQPAISVDAFKGTLTTDLLIHVPSDVIEARKVQIKAYNIDGNLKFTKNFFNITAINGTALIQFDDLQKGDRVDVRLDADNYGWLETSTRVLLRPDLIISSADAIAEVPVGDVLLVNVSINEINGDIGSKATVALLDEEIVLDAKDVGVGAGGMGSALLSAIFKSMGDHNLSIKIMNSNPAEYDETNNVYNLIVRAISPDLVISNVSAPVQITVGEKFEANVTITEQSGEKGANATIALLENGTVLDSRDIAVPAGGSGAVTLATIFNARGEHNLSIKIMNSIPPEYDETNNVYNLIVRAVSPDLAVSNASAPVQVAIGERFEVLAEISELYGDMGANATVALLENSTVLDSKTIEIPAGSSIVVSFNGSLYTAGTRNMMVKILSSVPSDNFQLNNKQSFAITVMKPLGLLFFLSKYSYQNVSLNTSHYISTSGHVDNSEEIELKENEILFFRISSNKSLSFPIDRIYLNITNEAGEGIVYEETGVNGINGTFTKYYPDSNAVLTLTIESSGINLSIESKSNQSLKQSKGYLYWWFKDAQEWNTVTGSSKGKLLRAREKLRMEVEVEDGSLLLAGSTVTSIVSKSYVGGWAENTDEGRFEQSRSVWIYSGSGETKYG